MVTRTVLSRWVVPDESVTAPSRRTSASYARGQSSSVPKSNPMMCSTSDISSLHNMRSGHLTGAADGSPEPWQVVRELGSPRRPVMWHVVTPQVQLVPDTLVSQQS